MRESEESTVIIVLLLAVTTDFTTAQCCDSLQHYCHRLSDYYFQEGYRMLIPQPNIKKQEYYSDRMKLET